MQLTSVRIRGFRSILDSGTFPVGPRITWIVGPNEAGKSAALEALQLLRPPGGTAGFDAEDYPRAWLAGHEGTALLPAEIPAVTALFDLEPAEKAALPPGLEGNRYEVTRYLDNRYEHRLVGGGALVEWEALEAQLRALPAAVGAADPAAIGGLEALIADTRLTERRFAEAAEQWVRGLVPGDPDGPSVQAIAALRRYAAERRALAQLAEAVPVFILCNESIRLASWIELLPLPDRLPPDAVEDWKEGYGNECLMKLLSLSSGGTDPRILPAELPELEEPSEELLEPFDPQRFATGTVEARLSAALREFWGSPADRPGAERVRVERSAGWLRIAVGDALGAMVPLEQRSQGLQWLLSFLVVLFAETALPGRRSVLLLDDPGLALDPGRRARFLTGLARLAGEYQVVIATHSDPPGGFPGGGEATLRLDALMEPVEAGTRIVPRG